MAKAKTKASRQDFVWEKRNRTWPFASAGIRKGGRSDSGSVRIFLSRSRFGFTTKRGQKLRPQVIQRNGPEQNCRKL
jgi:hypothetical protein